MFLAPALIAAHPVLDVFATNTDTISWTNTLCPLGVCLTAGPLVSLALGRRLAGRLRGGLLASAAILLFWLPAPLKQAVIWLGALGLYGAAAALVASLPYLLALAGLARWLQRQAPERLDGPARAVTQFALLVVLLDLVWLGQGLRRDQLAPPDFFPSPSSEELRVQPTSPGQTSPDVYFLVLDGFTRDDAMRTYLGGDDGGFVAGLRERGFEVGDRARSSYAWTAFSVSSALNLGHVVPDPAFVRPRPENVGPLATAIRHASVLGMLRARGYHTESASSGICLFDGMATDQRHPSAWNEFLDHLLLDRTLLGEVAPELADLGWRSAYDSALAALGAPVGGPPRFRFVHVLAPHPPFVRGEDGAPLPSIPVRGTPDLSFAYDEVMGKGYYARRYLQQVRWVGRRVLEQVDRILSRRDRESVILMMGDHGPRAFGLAPRPQDRMAVTHSILLAARVPAGWERPDLTDATPVNLFRILSRPLFGLNLPRLPDRSLYSPRGTPYEFVELAPWGRIPAP